MSCQTLLASSAGAGRLSQELCEFLIEKGHSNVNAPAANYRPYAADVCGPVQDKLRQGELHMSRFAKLTPFRSHVPKFSLGIASRYMDL